MENYLIKSQPLVKLGNTNSKITQDVYMSATRFNLILGPLLFNIYINDLPKTCPKLNCIMYADDTTYRGLGVETDYVHFSLY